MLTGYQCEVVAFIAEGEFVCHDCAHKGLDQGQLSRSELGLGSLSPVIRYTLDEYNSERVYEEAEQLYYQREESGGYRTAEHGEKWQHVEKIVEELGDSYNECCSECGEVIS